MRRHVIGIVSMAIGTFGIFLGACSSSNSGSGTASTSSDFINQYCGYIGSCCGVESLPSDGKQCRALLGAFETGTYNAQAGNQCLAAVQAASQKDPAWCVDNTTDTNTACNGAFGKNGGGGSVQPGGACKSSSDCASAPSGDEVICRNYYDFNTQASTDICQVLVPGKAGDGPCLGTETAISGGTETSYNDSEVTDGGTYPSQGVICRTGDGVTCESQNGTYKCVALGQVGDTCDGSSGSCVSTAYCDFSSMKCVARIADGAACPSSSPNCVTGDYCDSTSLTCKAKLASGAACTSSQQCQSSDCTNGKCGSGSGSLGLSLLCGSSASPLDGG